MYRYLFLFSCLFITVSLTAQVEAVIQFEEIRTNNTQSIIIQWDPLAEQAWEEKNSDRLDVMAVRTNISSSMLPVRNDSVNIYKLQLTHSSTIEFLLEIESVADGESIIVRNDKTKEVLYDSALHNAKRYLTPAVASDDAVIEWTSNGLFNSEFVLKTIYVDPDHGRQMIGFNTAMPCHPNAACKQDSMSTLIANSAMRIRMVMDEGIGWCTGSFINNTRNDRTPYVLLAYHCTFEFTPQYDLWRFDLEYRSDSCSNPLSEPAIFSMTGCERKAGGQASDFLLVLLNENVPLTHNVTFAGWDRDETTTPDTSYLIHHPNADIRKFSTTVNKAIIHPNQIGWSEGYTTPGNHHFRIKFTEGGHQAGSSGGPVFNQEWLLVAQLHGGIMGCEEVNTAFTGRLSRSWNLGTMPDQRLSDWLDPDNVGVTQLSSIQNYSPDQVVDVQGIVKDYAGRPVSNAIIIITGSHSQTIMTDNEGKFELQAISRNGQYHIVPSKNTNPLNGVSGLDIIGLQRHILGREVFHSPWQYIAGDATNSQSISAGDIVVLLKLILGKITTLPTLPSWVFEPAFIDLESITGSSPVKIEFQAIKVGDVNGNADPSE